MSSQKASRMEIWETLVCDNSPSGWICKVGMRRRRDRSKEVGVKCQQEHEQLESMCSISSSADLWGTDFPGFDIVVSVPSQQTQCRKSEPNCCWMKAVPICMLSEKLLQEWGIKSRQFQIVSVTSYLRKWMLSTINYKLKKMILPNMNYSKSHPF